MMIFQRLQFAPEGFSSLLGKPSLDVCVSFAGILMFFSVTYKNKPHLTNREFGK
jgi:hypothetical protein